MSTTLSAAREEFIKHMYRDNVVADRPRLLAVLDAVLAWSAAHPELIRFRRDENTKGVIRFEDVASNTVFWAASPRRSNVPLLQILPGATRFVSHETRAEAVARLYAHTREANPNGNIHCGFGDLKRPDGRAAVLELMDELLDKLQPANRVKATV